MMHPGHRRRIEKKLQQDGLHPAHRRRLEEKLQRDDEERGSMGMLRPNVSLTRDPLRREELPKERTELDYAPGFLDVGDRPWWLLTAFLLLVLVHAVRSTTLFGDWASSPFVFGAIGLGGVLAAVFYLARRRTTAAVHALLVALLVGGALATDNPFVPFLATAAALIAVAALAGTMQRHFGDWLAAYMFAPMPSRRVWAAFWRRHSFATHLLAAIQRLGRAPLPSIPQAKSEEGRRAAAREAPECAAYDFGFLVVGAALLLALLVLALSPVPVIGGVFALLVFALVVGAYAFLSLRSYRFAHGLSWADIRQALRDARATWFSYQGARAPGVFWSPAGSAELRLSRTAWTYRALAASTILLASYFPVGLIAFGPGPWEQQNDRVVERRLGADKPTLESARAGLPAETIEFAATLEPLERRDYLDAAASLKFREERVRARASVGLDLARDPEAWPLLSAIGLTSDPVLHALALLFALALCLTVPYALFWTTALAIAGRAAVHHYRAYASREGDYVEPRSLWAAGVERLQNSNNELERRHLWMGMSRENEYPVLLDRELLGQHMHILGGTGSGKTSRGITPLMEQLVGPDCSTVVLDLKGDMALFESARLSAKRAGVPFKWFSSQSHRSTFIFNPFAQRHLHQFTNLERSEVFTKALGLDYGEGYGQSHFSRENRDVLLRCLERFPDVPSFAWLEHELARLPKDGIGTVFANKKQREDAGDLLAVIRSLARIEALNVSPRGAPPAKDSEGCDLFDPLTEEKCAELSEQAIDMGDVLAEPSVLYFHLPASLHSGSDREIGKFALHALLTAAAVAEGDHPQVYVFIDEFQQIVSEDLDRFFEQARSMGISLILANQSPSQLSRVSAHMLSTIQANTYIQQVFAMNEPDQRRVLQELSGEAMYELSSTGTSSGASGSSETFRTNEDIGPRFRPNDIIEMSARDEECLITFKRNSGYTQFDGYPFRMYSEFHVTADIYKARLGAPWPAESNHPGTFTPPLEPQIEVVPATPPRKSARPKKPQPKTETTDVSDILDALGQGDDS